MGFARARLVLVCGTSAALLGCAQSRTEPLEPMPLVTPDSGSPAVDVAGMDAAASQPIDASIPVAMDASSPPRLDAAVGEVDAGIDAALDAAADARQPFLGEVRIDLLTKPVGRYQPRNLLAVWIEDEAGTPVKVIGRWAGIFNRYLIVFNQRVPGAFGGLFGLPPDGSVAIGELDPDVITTASLRAHEPRELTWDLTDYEGTPVPDGTYSVYIECSDDNTESDFTVVELHKGPEPMTVERGESERFAYVRLTYTPPEP